MRLVTISILALLLIAPVASLATSDSGVRVDAVVAAASQPVAKVAPKVDDKVVPTKRSDEKPEVKEEGSQKWWQNLLVTLISAIIAVVSPILSILLMSLIRKWNLKIEQEKVDWILEKGLGAGEQYMKGLLKDGKTVIGPDVAKVGAEVTKKLLDEYGLAKKFGKYVSELLEAKLGQKVIEAGGANAAVNGSNS